MDMGFRKDAIINFYVPDFNDGKKGEIFKQKLMEIPAIKAVSYGNESPAFNGTISSGSSYDATDGEKQISFDSRNGDENYIQVYDIPLVAGRNVRVLDSTHEALVNEKMLALLEVSSPEEAIGKTFNNGLYTIVGVMKDFNIASAHQVIRPMMFRSAKQGYKMHIALDKEHPASWKHAIAGVEKAFTDIYPDSPFEYRFLDEMIRGFYHAELKLSRLLNWAVGLSITIASLGLLGLAFFTANQRQKEIGIRKVLGASAGQIIVLLLKNLVLLVLIACLIAMPVAWYFIHKWLEDFAYKTPLNWWVFVIAALGLLVFAVMVLAARAYYTAIANPVKSLRSE